MGRSRELAELAAAYDGGSLGFRNRIINGDMRIWQRGTSGTTNNAYQADRWYSANISSVSRSTDVPSGFQFSLEAVGTSYPGSIQRIESFNAADLVGQSVTISFWAKNVSGTAILYVELLSANATDNFSALTSINNTTVASSPSSSWTRYTLTVNNLPAAAANGLELRINRDNASASTTRVTGVQLEAGSVATPFERRDYGRELMMCQRYFLKWTGAAGSTDFPAIGSGLVASSTQAYVLIPTPATLRATPVISFTGSVLILDGTASPALTSVNTIYTPGANSFWVTVTGSAGGLTGGRGVMFYCANATTNSFSVSAEL